VGFGWIADLRTEQNEALRLANEAVRIGNDDASVLANAGFTMVLFRQTQQAEGILERAVLLNPNLFIAYQVLALAKVLSGDVPTAREAAQTALRLSPQDSQLFGTYAVLAIASYFDHDLDAAESFARRSLDYRSNFKTAVAVRAACAARQHDSKTARHYMDILLAMAPELTDATLDNWLYFTDNTHRTFWHEGLARAGLPA
jgi:tetratricopeptide (TPR) repeat protein